MPATPRKTAGNSIFSVWEEVPKPEEPEKKQPPPSFEDLAHFPKSPPWLSPPTPPRPATLRVDLTSVTVHEGKAVTFRTESYEVRRQRFEASENDDF